MVDTIATTTSLFCLQNGTIYSLNPEVEGVSISTDGKLSVDTSTPIENTNLTIVMSDGYQTYVSPTFFIEVIKSSAKLSEIVTNEK